MGKVIGVNGVNIDSSPWANETKTFDFKTAEKDVFNKAEVTRSNGKYVITNLDQPILDLEPPKTKNMFMNYQDIDGYTSLDSLVSKLNVTSNYISDTPLSIFVKNLVDYNRFKIKSSDDVLQKAFPHVFFVRPDLNLCYGDNKDLTRLSSSLENNPLFLYAWRNSPDLVKSLIQVNGQPHTFNLFLSNKVTSFETSDEYIGTESVGKTYLGHQITYGKDATESKTAGELNINFDDDRYCHTYILNRIWMEYINLVSRGTISPVRQNIINKILDYAGSIYYIVTAEDGETIIFWSKYYGVFPSTSPSNQFSWNGEMIQGPLNYSFKYNYSFKEDFNPATLTEFNMNSGVTKDSGVFKYIPVFDPANNTVTSTWVGRPYIELCTDVNNPNSGTPYNFKLRFRR